MLEKLTNPETDCIYGSTSGMFDPEANSSPFIGDSEFKLSVEERNIVKGSFLHPLLVGQLTLATIGLGWTRFKGINFQIIAASIALVQIGHAVVTIRTLINFHKNSPKDADLLQFCNENNTFLLFRIMTNCLLLLLLFSLYTFPSAAVIQSNRQLSFSEIRVFVGVSFVCVVFDVLSAVKTLVVIRTRFVGNYIEACVPKWVMSSCFFCGLDSLESVSESLTGAHCLLLGLLVFVCLVLQLHNVFLEISMIVSAVLLAVFRYVNGSETWLSLRMIAICYAIHLVRLTIMLTLFVFKT